jgi:HEAT repeat protein
LAAALADPRPEVRDAAAFSLQFFGEDAVAAIPALLEALGDRDPGVRESAGMAVLSLGPNAIPGSSELLTAITRGDRELPEIANRLRERLAAN